MGWMMSLGNVRIVIKNLPLINIPKQHTVLGRVQLKHDGLNEKIVWTYRNKNCKKFRIKSRSDNNNVVTLCNIHATLDRQQTENRHKNEN